MNVGRSSKMPFINLLTSGCFPKGTLLIVIILDNVEAVFI